MTFAYDRRPLSQDKRVHGTLGSMTPQTTIRGHWPKLMWCCRACSGEWPIALPPFGTKSHNTRLDVARGASGTNRPAYFPACCRMVWTWPPIVIVPSRSAPVFCSTE